MTETQGVQPPWGVEPAVPQLCPAEGLNTCSSFFPFLSTNGLMKWLFLPRPRAQHSCSPGMEGWELSLQTSHRSKEGSSNICPSACPAMGENSWALGEGLGRAGSIQTSMQAALAQLCPEARGCPEELSVTLGTQSSCGSGEQQLEELWPSEQLLQASSTQEIQQVAGNTPWSWPRAVRAAAMPRGTESREICVQCGTGCPAWLS